MVGKVKYCSGPSVIKTTGGARTLRKARKATSPQTPTANETEELIHPVPV